MKLNFFSLKHLLTIVLFTFIKFSFSQENIADKKWWTPDVGINVITKDTVHNLIYIGGIFNNLGPDIPHGAVLDSLAGKPFENYPSPNGTVYTVIKDGMGGWFIGGNFSSVGDSLRNNIAQIDSLGNVTAWKSNVNNTVYALLLSGPRLYIGGNFTEINGVSRNRIAMLYASNGDIANWSLDVNNTVRAMIIVGSTVYFAGDFDYVNSNIRNRVASFDYNSGSLSSFTSVNYINGNIYTLAHNGYSDLFLGGTFTQIGYPRKYLGSIHSGTGQISSFQADADAEVYSLVVKNNQLYIGGAFNTLLGASRSKLASVNCTGYPVTVSSWNPNANFSVRSIVFEDSTCYLAGDFSSIGGYTRKGLAKTTLNGTVIPEWDPFADDIVYAISPYKNRSYAGGIFNRIGCVYRSNLACLDGNTGKPTDWAPGTSARVLALAINYDLNELYVGGMFTTVNGQSRNRLASFNLNTGDLTNWNPDMDNTVRALAYTNNKLLVGGDFTKIGTQFYERLAVFNTTTGAPTNQIHTDNTIYSILVKGDYAYIGGAFTYIGGYYYSNLASIYLPYIQARSWNPGVVGTVTCLTTDGQNIYAGGAITSVNGTPKNKIACFNQYEQLTNFNPPTLSETVYALAIYKNKLYAGGEFYVGSDAGYMYKIAAFDKQTGNTISSWNPQLGSFNGVYSLLSDSNHLFVGGFFSHINNYETIKQGLAVFNNCNSPIPTAISPQEFCNAGKISDLNIQGNNIRWYSDSILYNRIYDINTPLVDENFYYASQGDNCESDDRLKIKAIVFAHSAPSGDAVQTFCFDSTLTISDIVANGPTIKWYDAPTAGNLLNPSNLLVNNTYYYASLTENNCESVQRLSVRVLINPPMDVSTTVTDTSIIANSSNMYDYRWLDCDNNYSQIQLPFSVQNFIPTASGNYAVEITNYNQCKDTSDCVNFIVLNSLNFEDEFLNISKLSEKLYQVENPNHLKIKLKLVDVLGKETYSSDISYGNQPIDLNFIKSGIYFINLYNGLNSELIASKKIIIHD